MKKALTIIQMIIRTDWTVLLIIGLIFWGGIAPNLIVIHMGLGILLALLLWGLAFLGIRTRVPAGLVILIFAWSLVLPALGLLQAQILPSWSGHWIIKIVHVLVALAALAQAEMMGGRIKENLELEEEANKAHRRPTRKVRVSD